MVAGMAEAVRETLPGFECAELLDCQAHVLRSSPVCAEGDSLGSVLPLWYQGHSRVPPC